MEPRLETASTAPPTRLSLVRPWLEVVLGLSFVLRLVLALPSGLPLARMPVVFALGTLFDLALALYAIAPLLLYVALVPDWIWRTRAHRLAGFLGWCAFVYAFLFLGTAEWFFWDEFGARFNFIAVDYLAHTREVVGNLRESYPLATILAVLVVPTLVLALGRRRRILLALAARQRGSPRWALVLAAFALPALPYWTWNAERADLAGDRVAAELAGNGPYMMGHAFRSNSLDYEDNYVTLPRAEVLERLAEATGSALRGAGLVHRVESTPAASKRNLVLVTVESLSARYLQRYHRAGDPEGLTPRLDALVPQCLSFTRMYSTGIRTVRGLEALSLSLPPTPGMSIIKRPSGNTGLRTLGTILRDQGYDTRFVYGGYGLFDHMNAYFGANGYATVDRTDVSDDDIAGENIWGICDESLFDQVLRECDTAHAGGKPFHSFVMTTSNHRPYTYPEGRIDIPSGSGREGAVKYTDHAIGRFLDMAATKPWFEDTIFVIVADHCDSSRGYSYLPVDRFHIPILVYAPGIVTPGEVDGVCSQIDVAPTLLGLLGISYDSTFFGVDLARSRPERALLCNYLHLGLYDGKTLVTLGPQGSVTCEFAAADGSVTPAPRDEELVKKAIGYFQGASVALEKGLLCRSSVPVVAAVLSATPAAR